MVDKVAPLGMESSDTGGTENVPFPTPVNPNEDYITAKGIALEANDNRLIDLDGSGNIQFKDVTETTPVTVRQLRTASTNIYDNSTSGLTSTNVKTALDEIDAETRTQNIVYVKQNPGHADFSSIAAAIASVTAATSTNQFVILVGPGVYTEPQIVMKPFVSIHGVETQSVIIQPSDPTNHLIIGAAATLRFCTIKGVTTAGKAGIYSTASGFQLRNCIIRDNPINILVEGISSLASITADSNIITGVFTTGIHLKNSGAGVSGVFTNSIFNAIGASSGAKCSICEGASVSFIFSSLVANGSSTVNCLTVKDGATLKVLADEIKGFAKGIWVENVGAAPIVDILSANMDANTIDVQIDHASATGAIQGIITRSKVVNSSPNGVQLTYQDPVTGDLNCTRILATRGFATELTNLATFAGTHQILSTDAHTIVTTGSTAGTIVKLPNATTLRIGHQYWIINASTAQVTLQFFDGSGAVILNSGISLTYVVRDISTSAGIWSRSVDSSSEFSGTSPVFAQFGGNALIGRYLEIFPGEGSDTAAYLVPVSSTLIGLTIQASSSVTLGTIGIFKLTNLVNPVASISLTVQTKNKDTTLNVPLAANDELAIRVTGLTGTLPKPKIVMYISGA